MKLSTLIEEVVAPHRNFGVAINVALSPGDAAEPVGGRNPAILYGLGNLVENAVDFARERVEVAAAWSERGRRRHHHRRRAGLCARDHGPDRRALCHQPRPPAASNVEAAHGDETSGLGLGFFIAKTLLERSGATLDFENRAFSGARRRRPGALGPGRFRAADGFAS